VSRDGTNGEFIVLYLLQALLPYAVLSGVLGFVVGWFACGREDQR